MRRKFNTIISSFVFLSLLTTQNGGAVNLKQNLIPGESIITFEEPIPAPGNLQNQYCSDPATNKGVLFQPNAGILQTTVTPASGTHALFKFPEGEIDAFAGPATISFTTGQSFVGVMVGLDQHHDSPMTAILRAYDDPDPGEGTKLTPDPDPSVSLGNGPTPITTPLSFSMPGGVQAIRRVEIEFLSNFGEQEIIDDLTFSNVGPLCVTDNDSPMVQILEPLFGQSLHDPQVLLHYAAQDAGSGVASIRVSMLGAGNSVLSSYLSCGNGECPGFPTSNNVDTQYYTFVPQGTIGIRVEATDFAGHTGQAEVFFSLSLPDPTFNLWALGMEVTQGIQTVVPSSTVSRATYAPVENLFLGTPLVAGKRTVVRLYPGVENTATPVFGARATLSCFRTLAANPFQGQPCDGPATADVIEPASGVYPVYNNLISSLQRDRQLSWNFILPGQWTEPGGPRWLVGLVKSPINLPECGSYASGCDDGANLFVVRVDFFETAPLIIQPIFACVRRSAGQAKEDCLSDPVAGTLASDATDATILAEKFFWGNDWNGDGKLDPIFNLAFPVADGSRGIQIRPPILGDFVDGDLSTMNGIMSGDKMDQYLDHVCDRFVLDSRPPNLRYFSFVPPPTGPGGVGRTEYPCAIAKVDLNPARVGENDFCIHCADRNEFIVQHDEFGIAHEITHTFGVEHASCSHDIDENGVSGEERGGGCDPAPDVFPCPHGGICIGQDHLDEPVVFNTFNLAVLPPRNGLLHAHDYMSYGDEPKWISPHTYERLFAAQLNALTATLSNSSAGPALEGMSTFGSSQQALYVSGRIQQPGNQVTVNTLYQLPLNVDRGTGKGGYVLELQKSNGQVLSRRRFDPLTFTDGVGTSFPFFEVLPYSSKAARLVIKKGNTVLFVRKRGAHAPAINIQAPAGGEVWGMGPQTITWQGSDADGDALLYTVQYSPDLGQRWTTLALNLTETTWQVDASLLAGSGPNQALIRILASDGFNTTSAVSLPFTVSDKAPMIRIATPADGSTFNERQLIDFIGAAFDTEDGTVDEADYTWSSDRDGILGQGAELQLQTLSVGHHTITLTVQDRAGNTSQTSIAIDVLAVPDIQPIADAGSNQVVAVGATVQLDGSASFDPDGDQLNFSWRFVSVPDGLSSFPELNDPQSATPSFLASLAGEYVLELVVRDGEVNSFPSRVVIEAGNQTTVQIDVKPGNFSNRVELEKHVCKDDDHLHVAILTTPTFDAQTVDPASLKLGDPALGGTASPIWSKARDVELDGDLDMLLSFNLCDLVSNMALDASSTELVLTGTTLTGNAITGTDLVKVIYKD
jgi:REJ domain